MSNKVTKSVAYKETQDEVKWVVKDDAGYYEILGKTVGKLVDEKQKAYGKAFQQIGKIIKILYPDGVPPEKMEDFALIVRMLDKICRIANGNKKAFGENPFFDLVGYGLLGFGDED